jgi:hypothetical protein
MMTPALVHALRDLSWNIGLVDGHEEYVIFGSTSLKLRDIIEREPDDIDVIVTRRVWGALLALPLWEVHTPNAGDPPILHYPGGIPLNLFFAWRDDMVDINEPELIRTSEEAQGFRVATVQEVLRHKMAALSYGSPAVQKHRPDIEAILRYLAGS